MNRSEIKTDMQGPAIVPPAALPPRIPDHELLRRIGRGAYGEVWLARSVTGAYRAVKIVSAHSFEDTRPFEREFSGILNFEPISRKHDSQVHILHVGRSEGCFYYVMELADDQFTGQQIEPDTYAPKTLSSEIFKRGRLPFEECLRISLALATALDHLHSHGLVHRDIKPSNLIFVNGVPKLADIGLVTGVDATRSYVGTEGFAPPEGPGTPQADVYSLGKVLYEMCTGKDRQDFPELPTDLDVTADREGLLELNAVIGKACRHDPDGRYRSAKSLCDELLLLQGGKSLARLRTVERTLARLKRFSAAGIGVTLAVAAGFLWQSNQARQMKALATEARANLYAADINAAQRALEADNLRQALDLLRKQMPKPGEPDLRGFEWRYLWRQCQSEELFSLAGHNIAASTVAFSPDSHSLVTGSCANGSRATVTLWDLASRQAKATFAGYTDNVCSVSFSPNGKLVATACQTAVQILDAQTLQPLRSLPGSAVVARFSPAGKYLITAGTNGLTLWTTDRWAVSGTVDSVRFWRTDLWELDFLDSRAAFSPDGTRFAVPTDTGIKLYSIPDLNEQGVLEDRLARARFTVFSPDGGTLATCTAHDRAVKLWDVSQRQESRSLSGHSDTVEDAAFSPDGKCLVTCSCDQTLKLWDVATGKLIRSFRGHTEEVYDVAFSPDGKLLASVGKDGSVKIWDASAPPASEFILGDNIGPLGSDLEGRLVTYIKTNKSLTRFDPESRQPVSAAEFLGRKEKSRSFWLLDGGLFRDGRTVQVVESDQTNTISEHALELWDLTHRELRCWLDDVHGPGVFAPKRQLLATSTTNHSVSIWRIPSGTQAAIITNAEVPAAFSPDETMLATSRNGTEGLTDIWSLTGSAAHRITTLGGGNRFGGPIVKFSADSRMVAFSGNDSLIRVCEVQSGHLLATLTGHKRSGIFSCFSPDGRTLASMGDDGIVIFWQVATARELMKFQMPVEDIQWRGLGFSPDGRSLVAYRIDPRGILTQIWFAPSLAEIAVAEGQDYRSLTHDAPTWHAVGKALARRDRLEEAVNAFSEALRQSAENDDLESLRTSALQQRSQLFRRLGRLKQAGADNCAALNIQARDVGTPFSCIDLSAYYNGSLDRDWFYHSIPFYEPFPTLPRGYQTLPGSTGVVLDLRGLVQLSKDDSPPGFPNRVDGIALHQKCRRLHFLHATYHGESEGTEIGAYVVHFAGGQQEEIPIRYGQDLRDWVAPADETKVQNIAWTGGNSRFPATRLFHDFWENPHPEIEIESLDFVSKLTKCAPFLVAITAE